MAYKQTMEPKGSWIMKAVIVVLVAVLIVSVLYPKKLWNEHAKLIQDSRERMDNLNYVVQRYHDVYGTYNADLDSLLSFIETDSILVERSIFEFDRLSLYDAPNDSFLVGFTDLFHFDHIEVDSFSQGAPATGQLAEDAVIDSITLTMVPKPLYADVIAPVKMSMTSPKGVDFAMRNKGEDDIYWLVWSPGHLERKYLPYDEVKVPTKDFILYRPVTDLRNDPISDQAYELFLNTKLTMDGNIIYDMVREGREPDPAVAGDELHTNLFVNRLARKARSQVEQQLQRDTTLYGQQLQLQNDYFDVELELLKPGRQVEVEANREKTVPADSVQLYENPDRLRSELYKVSYDSLIRVWTDLEKTQNVLKRLTYKEDLKLSKVDTVGVTIEAPFQGTFTLKKRGLLDRIFSVGPVKNPGDIENNDLSWEEKR